MYVWRVSDGKTYSVKGLTQNFLITYANEGVEIHTRKKIEVEMDLGVGMRFSN